MKKMLLIMFGFVFLMTINFPAICQTDEDNSSDEGEEGQSQRKFSAGLQVGFKYTLGDWGKTWGNAWGYFGLFEYHVIKEIGIGIKTGYISWTANSETTDVNNDWVNVPFNLQFIYYFEKAKSFQAYGALETGINLMTYTQKVTTYDPKTLQPNTITTKHSYNKFGIAPVAGFLMPFGGFNMNFAVKYYMIFGGQELNNQNINYIGINAGLSYSFW